MRCKAGPLLTAGTVLGALPLAGPEHILEVTKLPGQPSSKFVNWKCRMSFTSLPFLIHVSRQLDSADTSALDLHRFMQDVPSAANANAIGAQIAVRSRGCPCPTQSLHVCTCFFLHLAINSATFKSWAAVKWLHVLLDKIRTLIFFSSPTRTLKLIIIKQALEMLCKT